MFNIGTGEFFLILVLLMIVFGPERLPQLFRQMGKAVADLKRFARDIDPELLQDFREITKDFESVRDEVASLRTDLGEIQRDISGAAKDVSSSLNEVVHEVETSTSLTNDPQAVRAAQAAAAAGATARRVAAPVGAAKGTAAGSSPAVAGAAVAATAAGAATTQAPAPATATSVAALEDEIIGSPVLLYGPGDGAFLDELVGTKVFPLPRSGARPPAPEPNGHDEHAALRSRHALMASLARRRQAAARPAGPRPAVRPHAQALARERTTRRG